MKVSLTRTRKHFLKNKNRYIFSFVLLFSLLMLLPMRSAFSGAQANQNWKGQGWGPVLESYQRIQQQRQEATDRKAASQREEQQAAQQDEQEEYESGPSRAVLTSEESASPNAEPTGTKNEKDIVTRENKKGYQQQDADGTHKLPDILVLDEDQQDELNQLRIYARDYPEMLVDGCYVGGNETKCPAVYKYMAKLQELQKVAEKEIKEFPEENITPDIKRYMQSVEKSLLAANNEAFGFYNKAKDSGVINDEEIEKKIQRIENYEHSSILTRAIGTCAGNTEWLFGLPTKGLLQLLTDEDSAIITAYEKALSEEPEKGSKAYNKKVLQGSVGPLTTILAAAGLVTAAPAISVSGAITAVTGFVTTHASSLLAAAGITTALGGIGSAAMDETQKIQDAQEAFADENDKRTDARKEYDKRVEEVGRILQYTRTGQTDAERQALERLTERQTPHYTDGPASLQVFPDAKTAANNFNASYEAQVQSHQTTYSAPEPESSTPSSYSSNAAEGLRNLSADDWEATFERAGMD